MANITGLGALTGGAGLGGLLPGILDGLLGGLTDTLTDLLGDTLGQLATDVAPDQLLEDLLSGLGGLGEGGAATGLIDDLISNGLIDQSQLQLILDNGVRGVPSLTALQDLLTTVDSTHLTAVLNSIFTAGNGGGVNEGGLSNLSNVDLEDAVVYLTNVVGAALEAPTNGLNVDNVLGSLLAGDDSIKGNDADNMLRGGFGNDTMDGGAGADTLYGGKGDDTFYVDNAGDKVIEANGQGHDAIFSSVSYSLYGQYVEDLTLTGSARIDAKGNGLANVLTGNSADNVLDGAGGADTMAGGAGNDTYVVDNAGDIVIETGSGVDTVKTSVSYALSDNVENIILTGSGNINGTGNQLANTLTGNAGNNVLDGGAGRDTMAGGAGNDTYIVDDIGDKVVERANSGVDTVKTSVSFSLYGQYAENLTLTGSSNIDGRGNGLDNVLVGNAGKNVLDGATGHDILTGGNGIDTFMFANTISPENVDHITDFKHAVDKIGLDQTYHSALSLGTLGTAAYKDIASGTVDASDRILYNHNTGELFYDKDGSGSAEAKLFAILDNHPATLTAGDFIVVT